MKKSDRQLYEMLGKEMKSSAESAKIPLKLQKESMVEMLKNDERKETDFPFETRNKSRNNVVMLRRLTAAAAMLAIVVTGTLVMRTGGGVKVIKSDSFYEGYKSSAPVKSANSYEDVEKAVEEILGINAEEKSTQKSTQSISAGDKEGTPDVQTTAKSGESLLKGYGEYVASAKQSIEGFVQSDIIDKVLSNEPDGITTYGDFKADIVKNDGKYLYIAATAPNAETGDTEEQIKIVKVSSGGKMENVSTIILSDSKSKKNFDECIEIYLKNDCLTAIMRRHAYSFTDKAVSDDVSTVAVCYDITDPYAPVKTREHIQDGEYISSNLYGNRLCLVTEKSISDKSEKNAEELIPSFCIDGKETKLKAEKIFIAVNDPEASYLFVTVTDITDFSKDAGYLAVLGCGNEVFCSPSAMAVAREFVSVEADENGEYNSLTEIYRFDIKDSAIAFSGSYIVKGSLIGGVSFDENNGCIRVLTSDSKASNIYVLDKNMDFVSGIRDIFPDEKVSDIKFIGNSGYVVVDGDDKKMMIVDFSNPSSPKVAGTVSAKAFSDDLYAVSETELLGISESDNGIITLTLVDVSDPSNPVAASEYSLGIDFRSVSWADSRSVMLVADKNIFGIPVLKKDSNNGTEITAYALFDMSGGKIVSLGVYNHDISYIGDAAVRGTCIEDILYTVSGEKIVAFSIDGGKSKDNKQTELPLN